MENNELLEEAMKYGFVRDQKVYLKPFMEYPERQVGEVKEKDEDALEYFAKRFEGFRQKVEALLEKINTAENKGSYLMKVLHLQEQIGSYEGLGDFTSLHRKLVAAEEDIKALISRNRDKNLATKIGIITEAEGLQESHDWQTTADRLKELRQQWIKTGPIDKALEEEVEGRFKTATDIFFQRKKDFFDLKQQMHRQALDKYKSLIDQSEALQESEEYETTTARLKELQNEWKTIGGNLPRKQANDLWNRFRAAHNHFFERLKKHNEQQRSGSRDKFFEDNLAAKKALATEAEGLLEKPLPEAVSRAKQLQADWKKIGPVRSAESDAVWERFVKSCDKVFEMSNLENVLRKKQPQLEKSGLAEQNQARVNLLRDFIKGDKTELEVLETNLGKLAENPANETFRQMLEGKIRTFNRRIQTKQELIEMYRQKNTAAGPSADQAAQEASQ